MKKATLSKEDKIKHLEFIQDVINRLSQNSFLIKGWTLTIISALIAYSASKNEGMLNLIAIVPVVLFWVMDAVFLRNEKYFRDLYDLVRETDEDFKFAMNVEEVVLTKRKYYKVFFNQTLTMFYLAIIVTLIALNFYSI